MDYVPESIKDCKMTYVPPNYKYIMCENFGHPDGMKGECWWCQEMTPYQNVMCRDEREKQFYISRGMSPDVATDYISMMKMNNVMLDTFSYE